MKMTVKENELRLVEEKKNAPKPKPQPRRDAPRRELNIRSAESEVDVRGLSAEEALFEVDNFLSRAIMAGRRLSRSSTAREPVCSARLCSSICGKTSASRAFAAVFTAKESRA